MKLLQMMMCVGFILGKILRFSLGPLFIKVDLIKDFEAIFTYK